MRTHFLYVALALFFDILFTVPDALHAEDAAQKEGQIEPAAVRLGRPVDFEKDIQPILDEKCVACHNVAIAESKLILEDVPAILKGGKRGPAVIAKEPDKSLMYLMAARALDPVMPPLPNKVSAAAFSPEELGLLRTWIEEGARQGLSVGHSAVQWQSVPSTMHAIYSTAVSTWGRWAACGRANQLDLYDIATGDYVDRLQDPALATIHVGDKPFYPQGAAHRDFVHALAFSPSADVLASAGYREVKLWQRPSNVTSGNFSQDWGVTAMAVSPDGKWLALGRTDNSIALQGLIDQNAKRILVGHMGPIGGVQFSADSSRLFSGSKDKSLRQWNVAEGTQTSHLETSEEVTSVALNLDSTCLFSGHTGDNVIRGWRIPFELAKPADGDKAAEPVKPIVEMKGHTAATTSLALLGPAGTHLLSASADSTWRVWEISTGNQTQSQNHGAPITGLTVKPDGLLIVTCGGNNARLWKFDGSPVAELKGSIASQRTVLMQTDADTVAKSRVALADAAFKAAEKNYTEREEATKKAIEQKPVTEKGLMEAKTKEEVALAAVEVAKKELEGQPDDEVLKKKKSDADAAAMKETEAVKKAQEAIEAVIKSIAQSESGQQSAVEQQKLAKGLLDNETNAANLVETLFNQAKTDYSATEKTVKCVAFVDEGKLIATAGDDGVIRLWSGTTGKPLEEIIGHRSSIDLLVSGQNRLLVSASDDKSILAWDANPRWNVIATLGPPPENMLDLAQSQFVNRVLSLAFSPDGKILATGGGEPSRSGELILWDVAAKSVLRTFVDPHSDTIFGIDFSSDGKFLVTGGADKFVKQFDVETGKLVRSFEGHTHHVLDVSWRGDGSRIVSAGADNTVKVWNVETGEQHRTIQNYAKQVTSIQFIGSTDNMISCSGDKTVKMHRSISGDNYRSFLGETDFIYSTACTRDESLAIAGGEDGVFRVWNGTNAQILFQFNPPKTAGETVHAKAQ